MCESRRASETTLRDLFQFDDRQMFMIRNVSHDEFEFLPSPSADRRVRSRAERIAWKFGPGLESGAFVGWDSIEVDLVRCCHGRWGNLEDGRWGK
jgi:hypothetical protein